MSSKVWLVTGANSGFGRAFVEAAVAAGDVAVGAVRRIGTLGELVAAHPDQVEELVLDVTDTAAIEPAVRGVLARHGRIDVLVNNAGRGHVGAFEETTEQELRDLFEVHVFGPANMARAVLPSMRERRSGAIVQMSSMGGQMSFAGFSAYSATKFALEGMSEALAAEVGELGIKVLIVEPGGFRTALFENTTTSADLGAAYGSSVGGTREFVAAGTAALPGDPAKAISLIREALEAENTPLRLPLGDDGVSAVLDALDKVRADIQPWEKRARNTAFDAE